MGVQNKFGVLRVAGQFTLIAVVPLAEGEWVFRIQGEPTRAPTRYSVQIDDETHLDLGEHPTETLLDNYAWRYMNHRCEPNLVVRGQDVYALRAIAAFEELTYNYNTTEYALAERFHCRCGSPHCPGEIRGFQGLSAMERARLKPWLAPHLARREERD